MRIDIMVMSQQDLAIVEHHQPLIRDAVIELLGKQTEDTIKSLSGREDLRKNVGERAKRNLTARDRENRHR